MYVCQGEVKQCLLRDSWVTVSLGDPSSVPCVQSLICLCVGVGRGWACGGTVWGQSFQSILFCPWHQPGNSRPPTRPNKWLKTGLGTMSGGFYVGPQNLGPASAVSWLVRRGWLNILRGGSTGAGVFLLDKGFRVVLKDRYHQCSCFLPASWGCRCSWLRCRDFCCCFTAAKLVCTIQVAAPSSFSPNHLLFSLRPSIHKIRYK